MLKIKTNLFDFIALVYFICYHLNMRRVKISFQYDGSFFCGFQKQKTAVTIQCVLEQAISKIVGHSVCVHASGRTDSGVHAVCQVAHFDIQNTNITEDNIVRGVNTVLPHYIRIMDVEFVSGSFHAQKSVKQKTYQYWCYISKTENPLLFKRALHLNKLPNLDKIREQINHVVGLHDFSSFCAADSGRTNFVREVFDFKIDQKNIFENQFLIFTITGNGFLYKMVRNLVGTLLEIGYGKNFNIDEILKKRDRRFAGKTVPAHGLYLTSVKY